MWIEATKNGKYKACERYTDPLTGKLKKVSITIDKDTRQARKAAQEELAKRIRQECSQSMLPEEITLKALVEAYRADQKMTVRQSTYQRNYFAANAIMKMLGENVYISKLTAPYVRQKFLQSGKAASTLNEHLARFRALMSWAYKNDMIADITFLDKLEQFKAAPHKEVIKDKYMEGTELRKLLGAMSNPVWSLLTELLALSGLRIGEALALEVSDIDLRAKQIHVTKDYDVVNGVVDDTKTSCSIRDVYIQPELEKVIRRINAEMKQRAFRYGIQSKLFMFDHDGSYLHYYAYNKYLGENTIAVLGRKLTPHSLRHTHASLLMEKGVPVDAISRRLGHENSRITKEIYLHVTKKVKEQDDELIRKVNLF